MLVVVQDVNLRYRLDARAKHDRTAELFTLRGSRDVAEDHVTRRNTPQKLHEPSNPLDRHKREFMVSCVCTSCEKRVLSNRIHWQKEIKEADSSFFPCTSVL